MNTPLLTKTPDTQAGPAFPQHSFWSYDYGAYVPSLPLSEDIKTDVVIIGTGFTGLSTAINIKQLDSACRVVLIEQEAVGYGASGRNSGWVWPNVSTYEEIHAIYGADVLRETYQYAKQAYTYVGDLIKTHELESDYRKTGVLRPSVSPEYERNRHAFVELCEIMGRSDQITEMDEAAVQEEIRSPFFYKALWDEELALIQPVKHARSLARLARSLGVEIFEQTPAISIREARHGVTVLTPNNMIKADRLVLATNAYTHLLKGDHEPALKRHQRPVFVYNMISRPLTDDEWSSVGWKKRNGIYSFGPASHFGNPTSDGRLHWCSDRFLTIPSGNDMSCEYMPNYLATSKEHTSLFFPGLKDLYLTDHWGGPVSVTMDRMFHLGRVKNSNRIFLSLGCNGNGVSLTHLNGKILAELVTGQKSELCDLWFVDRKARSWPGSWLTVPAMRTYVGYDKRRSAKRATKAGLSKLVTVTRKENT